MVNSKYGINVQFINFYGDKNNAITMLDSSLDYIASGDKSSKQAINEFLTNLRNTGAPILLTDSEHSFSQKASNGSISTQVVIYNPYWAYLITNKDNQLIGVVSPASVLRHEIEHANDKYIDIHTKIPDQDNDNNDNYAEEIAREAANKLREFYGEPIRLDIENLSSNIIVSDPTFNMEFRNFNSILTNLLKIIKTIIDQAPSLDKAEQITSPIIIDMNGDGVNATKLAAGIHKAIYFDLDGNGFAEKTAWVDAYDALLVLDKNGNGKIDNGTELFGNHSLDAEGKKSFADGYAALAAYDENQDGKIDAQDTVYAQLQIWRDMNQDGISETDELMSLAEAGIISIDLNAQILNERDAQGNLISHRGTVNFADGREAIAEDIWFQVNTAQSKYIGEKIQISAEIQALPNVQAFGNVVDLHMAMQKDKHLTQLVEQYIKANQEGANNTKVLLEELIYQWTDAAEIDPHSRDPKKVYGHVLDARKLVSLENLTGKSFSGTWCWGEKDPNPHGLAAPILNAEFEKFAQYVHSHILLQTAQYQHLLMPIMFAILNADNQDQSLNWQALAQHFEAQIEQGNISAAQEEYQVVFQKVC